MSLPVAKRIKRVKRARQNLYNLKRRHERLRIYAEALEKLAIERIGLDVPSFKSTLNRRQKLNRP